MSVALCPCGRLDAVGHALAYAACCGRYVEDFARTPAPDAETLMRSRYSAFVQERPDYLRATWHASKRPSKIGFEPGAKWLGLDVRDFRVLDQNHAEVEFVARQRDKTGRAVRMHERSRFVREQDKPTDDAEGRGLWRWYYVDGDWK